MGDAPTQVGAYRILGKLGEGGMGTVYEAARATEATHVAIKILHEEHARSEEFLARFFNEAQAVTVVDHPGLVQVWDSGKLADGTAYIVMELLTGEALSVRMKRSGGALPVADVLRLAALVADSLAAAHDKGIVHRDLKPENIMIVPDASVPGGERTKLLDFGIAKLSDAQEFVKTRTNAMLGTPIYMSPEQCRGAGKVDDRADVYSFGVLLFAMTAGRPPFSGEGMGDIMGKHMYEPPPPLEEVVSAVPAPLADLVARLLAKDKQQRPPMREVHAELVAMAQQLPNLPAKPRSRGAGVNAGISTLSAVAVQTQNTELTGSRAWKRKGLAAGSVLVVLALGAVALLSGRSSRPAATAVAPKQVPEPAVSATVRKVRWKIDSQPSGASITRQDDGQLLCHTPCVREELPGSGLVRLRLEHPGYSERDIELSQNSDAARDETLEPLRHVATKAKRPALSAARATAVTRPAAAAPPVEKPAQPTAPAATPPAPIAPAPPPKPVVHVRPKIED